MRDLRLPTLSLLALASTVAGAQSLSVDLNAYYGTGPASVIGSGVGFGTLGSSPYFSPPVDPTALAQYDVSSDEGPRRGSSRVGSYAEFGHLATDYTFSEDVSLYNYLAGDSRLQASDDLFLTNPDGATQGRYRVRVDVVRASSLVSDLTASVVAGGVLASGIAGSTTLYSPEMDFFYGSPISAYLELNTQASSGVYFGSFDSGTIGGSFNAYLSFEITDLGGARSFDQSSLSGAFYDVRPIPEPASVAALAVGALALLRRRKRS